MSSLGIAPVYYTLVVGTFGRRDS